MGLALNEHEVPVDGGFVSIVAVIVAVSGGQMDGPFDLFVKERVVHRFEDVRVDANGEFSEITRVQARSLST